jgi:hypothetical protein
MLVLRGSVGRRVVQVALTAGCMASLLGVARDERLVGEGP